MSKQLLIGAVLVIAMALLATTTLWAVPTGPASTFAINVRGAPVLTSSEMLGLRGGPKPVVQSESGTIPAIVAQVVAVTPTPVSRAEITLTSGSAISQSVRGAPSSVGFQSVRATARTTCLLAAGLTNLDVVLEVVPRLSSGIFYYNSEDATNCMTDCAMALGHYTSHPQSNTRTGILSTADGRAYCATMTSFGHHPEGSIAWNQAKLEDADQLMYRERLATG